MPDLSNITILIAEDEKPMLKALVDKFTHEGFNVIESKNGEEALKSALQKHPNIILLDLVMPKMDGLVVLKKLREDGWGKTVPIIILTNLNMDNKIIREVVALEPSFYLMKSEVKLEEIISKVREILKI